MINVNTISLCPNNIVYGYIYAISEGTSTIYASAQDGSGVTGSCNVTVVAPIYVNSIYSFS